MAFVLLSACGFQPEEGADAPSARLRVLTTRAVLEDSNQYISGVGSVSWRHETALSFTSGGKIAAVFVNEGDRVRRGQLLATLSTAPILPGLNAALAEQARATAQLDRYSILYGQGWLTKAKLGEAKAEAEAASAAVKERRYAFDTAKIVAPDNGVVLRRLVEAQQSVDVGTAVVVIGESSSGRVLRVPVSGKNISHLSIGMPAEITLAVIGNESLSGQILEIGSQADLTTGAFDVEIGLPFDPRLLSGMIGKVKINARHDREQKKLLVATSAILSARVGEAFVYVVDSGSYVHIRKISIGETTGAGTYVLKGLEPHEVLASSRLDQLRNGMKISVVEPSQ